MDLLLMPNWIRQEWLVSCKVESPKASNYLVSLNNTVYCLSHLRLSLFFNCSVCSYAYAAVKNV